MSNKDHSNNNNDNDISNNDNDNNNLPYLIPLDNFFFFASCLNVLN